MLIKAIARGRAWFEELAAGRARSLQELAKRDGISRRYIRRLVGLAFLSPELVEAILQGRQPVELTATRLTESICRWTGPSSTNCSQAKPQLRTDVPGRGPTAAARRCKRPELRRWDCINARQRERAKESRFAACTSLLTSPATRRPPPKCGAFRL